LAANKKANGFFATQGTAAMKINRRLLPLSLCWVALGLALSAVSLGAAAAPRAALIKDNVAIFYPGDFDANANLPSFALLEEPTEIGTLPDDWKDKVEFSSAFGQSMARIRVASSTNLYGGGEALSRLARKGSSQMLWNTDNFGYVKDDGARLYQSHPWVLAVRADGSAFGVLADNTWKQDLSLGDDISFSSEGPAFRVLVIEGETPQEVLAALADLTGKMPLPPLWSLGFQQSRYSYVPDSRAREIVDTFRARKIPIDVLWFDIDYMDEFRIFTFDAEQYPDPKAMNAYLHQHKMKGVWMIDPGVAAQQGYPVYDSGTAQDVWVKTSNGDNYLGAVWPGATVFPDFTQPKTAEWWGGLYREFMAENIDGVWNDMNEPADFEGPEGTMPVDNFHAGGLKITPDGKPLPPDSHLRYHNVYGMLMVKASREGIRTANADKRPFILTRANYIGGQRYAATWTGDNDSTWAHLRLSIPMVLNLGLSGQPFSGPDIGGFKGNATPELFGHWMAVGAFYPFARAHTINTSLDQEPWAFGKAVEDASRTALERRYRLMPYLYTQFYQASTTGIPVMQPTFFADVTDTELRAEDRSFLFGPDLLIVPKWADKPAMPKGAWRILSLVGEDSSEDVYQPDVRIRDGAIVPAGKVIQSTANYSLQTLTLFISLDAEGKAQGRLYQDAGDGYAYTDGEYALVDFSAHTSGNTVRLRANVVDGDYALEIQQLEIKLVTDSGVKTARGKFGETVEIRL
jgi:alpha-glucosidase